MASKKDKEKEEKTFNAIKMEVSKWYDANNCLNMLKVLFRDKIEVLDIPSTLELLNELFKHDHMSSTDLTLLSATVTVTKHLALQRKIEEKLPSFPKANEGTVSKIFTPHRQKLMKFGMTLSAADVRQIDGIYNTPLKNYTDSWSMIIDLEKRLKITEGDMEDFIESLDTLDLHLALKALTEEIPDTPSATDTPSDTQSGRPQNPSWMKELSARELQQLLYDVSEWWDKLGSINMLKVILNDFENITVAEIEQQMEANPLFQLLLANGYINPTNVDCLIEAVVLGGQSGVEPKIKETIPTFPGFSKVVTNRFSKHRRNLIAFGKVLDAKNKNRIGHLYSLNVSKLKDQWCLILQLEKKLILTEDDKDEFITTLNKNDMKAEAKALTRF